MPIYFHLLSLLSLMEISCFETTKDTDIRETSNSIEILSPIDIRGISLPPGYSYVDAGDNAYRDYLLTLKLKKNKTIYLYNGTPGSNQDIQYGVLDINIGKKDLMQCADAAMNLRAGYLFEKKRYNEIRFLTTSGIGISFESWLDGVRWKEQRSKLVSYMIDRNTRDIQTELRDFLDFVFAYCGTYSLSRQLRPVNDLNCIQPGDVFVEGGFPGHAVTVMAVAKNKTGKKIFLLSQGYMPAQDIHLLKNSGNAALSPWYNVDEIYPLCTPRWQFGSGSLKRW